MRLLCNNVSSPNLLIQIRASCSTDEHGLSIDADVAMWLNKRSFDGEPPLHQFHDFVLVTSLLHNEFDEFKKSYSDLTKPGYSMFPLIELLDYWNRRRSVSSHPINLFNKSYLHLHCTEVDDLCDWVQSTKDLYYGISIQIIKIIYHTKVNDS